MNKINLGDVNALYPMPAVLVGTVVEGKIDYSKVNPLFFDMSQLKYWNLGILMRVVIR